MSSVTVQVRVLRHTLDVIASVAADKHFYLVTLGQKAVRLLDCMEYCHLGLASGGRVRV